MRIMVDLLMRMNYGQRSTSRCLQGVPLHLNLHRLAVARSQLSREGDSSTRGKTARFWETPVRLAVTWQVLASEAAEFLSLWWRMNVCSSRMQTIKMNSAHVRCGVFCPDHYVLCRITIDILWWKTFKSAHITKILGEKAARICPALLLCLAY